MRTTHKTPSPTNLLHSRENLKGEDPSDVIASAIRFGIIGRVTRQGVPASVRAGLRHYASAGEPVCTLVLTWLDDLLLADLQAVEQRTCA